MTKLEMLISPTIHAAAFAADEIEAKRLCDEMQNLWDTGCSFVRDNAAALMLAQLCGEDMMADSQEELDAAVSQLQTQLAALAIRKTIAQMGREECVGLVQALDHLDLGGRVQVLGEELRSCEIRHIWNNQHPNEAPILPTAGLAPEI